MALTRNFTLVMVLFDDVVQVLAVADLNWGVPTVVELVPHAHSSQRSMARLEAVKCDAAQLAMSFRSPTEEDPSRRPIADSTEPRAYSAPFLIDCSVQVHPATVDLYMFRPHATSGQPSARTVPTD
jgi:hypothetical protein